MKKILIAEDEDVLLKVLIDRFKDDDWDVTGAINGEEAIKMLKDKKFDVILLDIVMPIKDGFAVLEEIKQHPELKEIPVVMLSNLGADEDIKKALSLGAVDYYVKVQHPIGEILEKANEYATGGHMPKTDKPYSKE